MFEAIFSKISSGFIAVSLFFLSSYIGNNARIEELDVVFDDGVVRFSGVLFDAFENDFEEIFLSGLEVKIVYEVIVYNNKRQVTQSKFTQMVIWDTAYQYWIIYLDGLDNTLIIDDYIEMVQNFSQFGTDLYFDPDLYETLDFKVTARLEDLYLPTSNNYLKLMLLWNRKVPEGKISVRTRTIK